MNFHSSLNSISYGELLELTVLCEEIIQLLLVLFKNRGGTESDVVSRPSSRSRV